MAVPHDPNITADIPEDSLDAGLAAGFGRPAEAPRSTLTGWIRPVLLKEAEGESAHIVKPNSDAMPSRAEAGDRYQLAGEIARGGMGAVLRGRDVDLGRDLAVKVLLEKYVDRPEIARRFFEEAQIGGQLQHPGVVPVYDIGRFGDRPFFTMKLVKGLTLAAILSERADATADRPRLLGIALQVTQTLAYAHAKGVIHRDLKPANIMVGAFGEVQVMDWGLAKVLAEGGIADEERAASRAASAPGVEPTVIRTARSTGTSFGTDTEAGSLLGTPAYMPPEQANGDIVHLDRRADVFGLGAILCEILTGQPPYVGRSGEEVRRKAANGDLADAMARLDECGADTELVTLTKKCLSPEAIDRPKDAQEVADALTSYLNSVQERLQAAERERAVAVVREAEQRKKRKVQLALAAAVVALMLSGGVFAFWRNEQAQLVLQREARNAEAVASLLNQAEEALKADDAAKAAVVLEAAKKRSAEGGAEQEAERLKLREADLALLREFDAIDQFRRTWSENRFPDLAIVAVRTRDALTRFGADPDATSADDAAARVIASAVRERIVSALDRLLRHQKTAGVRAALRQVDANPYRDAVRDAVLANDITKMTELVGQPTAMGQPPGFVAFMGDSLVIPVERRRELLKAALYRRPRDIGLLMSLGDTFADKHQGWEDEWLRWYQAAVAAAPANAAAHNNLGRALKEKGDLDGAITCLQKAIELDPKLAYAYANLGIARRVKKQFDEAIVCYRKAMELDPNDPIIPNNLANVLKDKGQLDEAIVFYNKAIALDPNNPLAHANLGSALADKGQVNEGIECCRTAISLDPTRADAYVHMGNILSEKKQDYDGAIACFEKAIALNPKITVAHVNLGNALKRKGRVDAAIESYRTAIRIAPKEPGAHRGLGLILGEGKGEYDAAIACFRKAIELDPKDASTYSDLGGALQGKHQWDEAIACYRKAIELDPKHAKAHSNLGAALADKGQVDEAMTWFRQAIALDPKEPKAHANLGLALKRKGQFDEAIPFLRQAIALDPTDAQSHADLGNVLQNKGQFNEAIDCYRQAITLDPKNTQALNNLGGLLINIKQDPDGAIACFRKVIEYDPKNTMGLRNLGTALASRGQWDEAIACLKKAIELDPTSAESHGSLGNALLGQGQTDQAIACFKKAIELDPKDPQAHGALGSVLLWQGRYAEARDASARALALLPEKHFLRAPASQQVKDCERFLKLEARLPRLISGEDKAASAREGFDLLKMCVLKKMYAAAARFGADTFAADPKQADDLQNEMRYNAACAAALAAAGQGEDAAKLDDKERAHLRQQALDWLRADLALRAKQLETGKPADRAVALQALLHWQKDADLVGLRDAAALAKLPEGEQKAFTQLWGDVAALLGKSEKQPKSPSSADELQTSFHSFDHASCRDSKSVRQTEECRSCVVRA